MQNDDYEIIVADNGSTDNSVDWLAKQYPSIKCIVLDKNYGFTGGYNRALKQIDAYYFLLLNSDIEPSEKWLDYLVEAMDSDEKIGACQPKIRAFHEKNHFEYAGACGGYIDYLAYPFCRGRIFFTAEEDKGQYEEPTSIFWASGACLMIKASIFKAIGGFDEDFFAHMEEIDLCWRIQNLGYDIKVIPKAVVYHVGGGTLSKENPKKTYLNYRNNLALIFKNAPFPHFIILVFKRMLLDGIAGAHALTKGEYRNTIAILKAHFAFYAWIPSLIKKRGVLHKEKNFYSLKGVYSKSIVFDYFLRKKKHFSDLEF